MTSTCSLLKKRRKIYLFIYFDGRPSHWNVEPLLLMLQATSVVRSSVEAKWRSPKSSQLVFGIDIKKQFTHWLCLHHCRSVSVTCTTVEPSCSGRPFLSLFHRWICTFLHRYFWSRTDSLGYFTLIMVSVCQLCPYQKKLLLSPIYSSLLLFARPVNKRCSNGAVAAWGKMP